MNDGFQSILGIYSIIIGLGVSKLLEGVKDLVVSGRTVRGNALYAAMVAIGLLVHVTSWLSLWSLRNVEIWGVWSFLLIMMVPLVMYLYSAVTVPDDAGSKDMNAYYLQNAARMHALLITAIGFNALAGVLMHGHRPDMIVTLGRLAALALLLACAVTPRAMRLHRIILPVLVVGLAALVPFLEFPIK